MVSARFPNRPFDLRENFWLIRQDIGSNASLVGWELMIDKVSYSPTYNGDQTYQDMRIDGNIVNSARWNGYDFRGNGPWQILRGENWIGHNGDGTKTFSINGHANFPTLGAVNVYSNFTLPTIPRASRGSFPNGDAFDAGTSQLIWTSPASGDFRHDIDWYFGNRSGRALTNVAGDGWWGVPLDLIDQIPSDTTGVGKIRTHTYDRQGGNMIGWNETNFRIYVPGNIGPSITGPVTATEANAAVASKVGKFVQNLSSLNVTIGDSSSQYGAGIASGRVDIMKGSVYRANLPGMSVTTPTLVDSGAVTVRGNVIDTRNKFAIKDITIDVLPYTPPTVSVFAIDRFRDALGTVPDAEAGEFVKVTLNSSVQSLINSTQKNAITVTLNTRKSGDPSWVGRRNPATSGIAYNGTFMIQRELAMTTRVRSGNVATVGTSTTHGLVVGDVVTISGSNNSNFNGTFTITEVPSTTTFRFTTATSGTVTGSSSGVILTSVRFPATEAHDIRVQVADVFNSIGAQTTLSVGAVFMHWGTGLGVGKFWERGKLDVGGPAYMESQPIAAGPVPALLDPAYAGPGPARVTFLPGDTLSTEAYEWSGKYERWGNRAVDMVRSNGKWKILGHSGDSGYGGKISLESALGSNYTPYNKRQSVNEYNEPRVQRLPSGIVVLSGLLSIRGSVTGSGELVVTLPPGTRPDYPMIFPVENSGNVKTISIGVNGEIRWEGSTISGSFGDYVSLDGIAYPAAGVATWTDVSEWANNWTSWSTNFRPSYWKDPYGVVWFKGLVTGGTKGADTVMFKVPATHAPALQTHNTASTDAGHGFVSTFPITQGSGGDRSVAWKGGNPSNSTWLSLCGVRIVTADAYSASPWLKALPTGNGWRTTYAAQYPSLGVTRRPDGLPITEGLIGVGNDSTAITTLHDWVSPEKIAILRTTSGDLSRRIDIHGLIKGQNRSTPYGLGSHNSWTTFDGLVWMVGD